MKLNLGCGPRPIDGYTNVDIQPPADVLGDFTTMTFEGASEVRMSHILEHISWRRTEAVLHRVRSWCVPGAKLIVEVPDMVALCQKGTGYHGWQQWIFGEQGQPGEYHMAGFTAWSLKALVLSSGFEIITARCFPSTHPDRVGYPCVEVVARAS